MLYAHFIFPLSFQLLVSSTVLNYRLFLFTINYRITLIFSHCENHIIKRNIFSCKQIILERGKMQIKRKNCEHLKSMLLSDGINDPEYVETFKNFWNKFLKQGLSVVAFTENVNGGKPIIAGCNMLGLSFKGEEFDYNAIKVSFIRFLDLRKENKIARNGFDICFPVGKWAESSQSYCRVEQKGKCV